MEKCWRNQCLHSYDHINSYHPFLLLKVSSLVLGHIPDGSVGKETACKAGDTGSIPGSGRCPEYGNGNLLQYSCWGNPMDRGAWWVTVHSVTKGHVTEHTHRKLVLKGKLHLLSFKKLFWNTTTPICLQQPS